MIRSASRQLNSLRNVRHLLLFDIGLQVGVPEIMMGMRENENLHLPNRLNANLSGHGLSADFAFHVHMAGGRNFRQVNMKRAQAGR
jgi:hypothetical protein